MRQTFFYSLLTLAAVALLTQAVPAEARHHCRSHCHSHSSTRVQLNVGNTFPRHDTYVVRSYQRVIPGQVIVPAAPVLAPAPVIAPGFYGPCTPPAVIYPAPAYVEQVYITPAPRPVGLFSGLSFSWNFFK